MKRYLLVASLLYFGGSLPAAYGAWQHAMPTWGAYLMAGPSGTTVAKELYAPYMDAENRPKLWNTMDYVGLYAGLSIGIERLAADYLSVTLRAGYGRRGTQYKGENKLVSSITQHGISITPLLSVFPLACELLRIGIGCDVFIPLKNAVQKMRYEDKPAAKGLRSVDLRLHLEAGTNFLMGLNAYAYGNISLVPQIKAQQTVLGIQGGTHALRWFTAGLGLELDLNKVL